MHIRERSQPIHYDPGAENEKNSKKYIAGVSPRKKIKQIFVKYRQNGRNADVNN